MGTHTTFQAGTTTTAGYLALPERGHGPGVLVLHAWWGLTAPIVTLCERLAQGGFVAFAPDLNAGRTAATIADAEALMKARDRRATSAAADGALAYLHAHPAVAGEQLGVIGFSMGGSMALDLASDHPDQVNAAVVFYGTGSADFTAARAAYLAHYGDHDAWEPDDEVQSMLADIRAAGREVTLHVYPGVSHWFFESDRPEYDPRAADLAWERTRAFLRERLNAA